MGISEQCKEFFREYGSFTKDGVPVGVGLMSKPVIKIGVLNDIASYSAPNDLSKVLNELHGGKSVLDSAPPNFGVQVIEELAVKSVSPWYKGELQFVDVSDDPDVVIGFYSIDKPENAFATLPPNDQNPEFSTTSSQYLMFNTVGIEAKSFDQLLTTSTHEWGHVFGLMHHLEPALENIDLYKESCSPEEQENLIKPSVMGLAAEKGFNEFDAFRRDVIHDHTPDVMKP